MIILDTTIRDGSYSVDFKFTCSDIKNAVSKLVKLGIDHIEIGHGLGLNASSPKRGISFCSDEAYLDAAREVSTEAKIGMFCIPGIAQKGDIAKAKAHGLSFVRIGVTADNVVEAIPYVDEACNNDVIPMVNFIKSYIYEADYIARQAKTAFDNGARVVYLVDSAGCMLPEEVQSYVSVTRETVGNRAIGFHGHNNLGLAVANSLACTESGGEYIDCTFQGIGRSLGNTPTEAFVMAYKKKYGDQSCEIDVPKLLEYGYVLLKEIAQNRVIVNPLDLICGYCGFHSSFLKDIFQCCQDNEVDPLRLIIAYSALNRKTMDYNLLCEVAETLPKDDFEGHPYSFRQFFSNIYNDY